MLALLAFVAATAASHTVMVAPLTGDDGGKVAEQFRAALDAAGVAAISTSGTAEAVTTVQVLGKCSLDTAKCVARAVGLTGADLGVGGVVKSEPDGITLTAHVVDLKAKSQPPLATRLPPGDKERTEALRLFAVRLLAPEREKGSLVVNVTQKGASVTVDKTVVGTSPLAAPLVLPPGKHDVFVDLTGRESFHDSVDVVFERTITLDVNLRGAHDTTTAATPATAASTTGAGAAAAGKDEGRALRVLVLDLRNDNAPASTAATVRDEIAVTLGHDERLDVLSSEDLRRAMSLQAEKSAAGCAEDSCLAELGAALGARYIVHGSVSVLGASTIVHLNLFDTDHNKAVSRETAEAKGGDDLLPAVRAALERIRSHVAGAMPSSTPAPAPSAPMSGLVMIGGITAGAGALVLALGTVAVLVALPTVDDKNAPGGDRANAQTLGAIGVVGAVVGGAALVAGAGVLAWGAFE